ncbi:hypothetical protein [Shimia sediminis]|uniref:hypothetical protein n=1 Tax=Shimia sediminis TaxID=2497945 RepID=UPI001F3998B2|nr:hypothetical protein [Shimia sediminis]
MMTTESFQALRPRPRLKGIAFLAIVFGSATIISGGKVLFGPDAVREMAGRVVPFVVWINFFSGFAYIAAGLAIWRALPWALGLSIAIAVVACAVTIGFGIWVAVGGAYELRTVGALTLRTGFWVAIALALWRAKTR